MDITVIVPIYNREKIVKRTLDSIAAQTHHGIELILVDNNSSDNSLEIITQFALQNKRDDLKISILTESIPGAARTRNTGLKAATSQWVIFFDSDDTMDNLLLESYAKAINDANGNLDLVCCRGLKHFQNGKTRESNHSKKNALANHILHANLTTNRYIIKKDFLSLSGKWNEELPGWDDLELGVRILLQNPRMAWIESRIFVHNHHQSESITGNDYSSKLYVWLKAVDVAEQNIRIHDIPNKKYYLMLLEYKRLTLAGLSTYEKSPKGKVLYNKIMNHLDANRAVKFLFAFLYRYLALGLPGGSWIIKAILPRIL